MRRYCHGAGGDLTVPLIILSWLIQINARMNSFQRDFTQERRRL
jgi:hypothetical protein